MTDPSRDLDRIDRKILAVLQDNARASNKELAAHVGLAPSSCLERVKRLIRDGVIRGFHAEVDPQALGVALEALVFVRFAQHQRSLMDALWAHLESLPEVRDLYDVAGSHDLVVHVAVRDVAHLRSLVADEMASRAELGQLETSLIFKHQRTPVVPDYGPDEREPDKSSSRRRSRAKRR